LQEIEKILKEHKEKVTADIEQRVVVALNEMAPSGGLPLVQVPSTHKVVVLPQWFLKSKGQ
jgi:hypothetical protein